MAKVHQKSGSLLSKEQETRVAQNLNAAQRRQPGAETGAAQSPIPATVDLARPDPHGITQIGDPPPAQTLNAPTLQAGPTAPIIQMVSHANRLLLLCNDSSIWWASYDDAGTTTWLRLW